MTSSPFLTTATVRPGYRCECTTTPDTAHSPVIVATLDATSPTQAVRWIRIAARTLASSLERDAFNDAWDWLTHGHQDASDALDDGEPCTFAISHHHTRIEWTARPVLYLPMAPLKPTSPRACLTDYPAHIG